MRNSYQPYEANGIMTTTAVCGMKTDVYSRVVGYYRPTNHWNPGKKQEFRERRTFHASTESADKLDRQITEAEAAKAAAAIPAMTLEDRPIEQKERPSSGGGETRKSALPELAYAK